MSRLSRLRPRYSRDAVLVFLASWVMAALPLRLSGEPWTTAVWVGAVAALLISLLAATRHGQAFSRWRLRQSYSQALAEEDSHYVSGPQPSTQEAQRLLSIPPAERDEAWQRRFEEALADPKLRAVYRDFRRADDEMCALTAKLQPLLEIPEGEQDEVWRSEVESILAEQQRVVERYSAEVEAHSKRMSDA